mmetsp:Transcript_32663/g.90134  ORF Transcript_32663/g.90134 Transcript_32663/m.90134 type:complete len:260 (-) Transcript_32663:224-1003(-)
MSTTPAAASPSSVQSKRRSNTALLSVSNWSLALTIGEIAKALAFGSPSGRSELLAPARRMFAIESAPNELDLVPALLRSAASQSLRTCTWTSLSAGASVGAAGPERLEEDEDEDALPRPALGGAEVAAAVPGKPEGGADAGRDRALRLRGRPMAGAKPEAQPEGKHPRKDVLRARLKDRGSSRSRSMTRTKSSRSSSLLVIKMRMLLPLAVTELPLEPLVSIKATPQPPPTLSRNSKRISEIFLASTFSDSSSHSKRNM